MNPLKVLLLAEACGDPVTGMWCDRCMLPAAVGVPVRVSTPDGVLVSLFVATVCTNCGPA